MGENMVKLSEKLLLTGLTKEMELLIEQLGRLESVFEHLCETRTEISQDEIQKMQNLDHAIQRSQDIYSLLKALHGRLQWGDGKELTITELYSVLTLRCDSFTSDDVKRQMPSKLNSPDEDLEINWF